MKILLRRLTAMLAMMIALVAGTAVAADAAWSDCGTGLACIWAGPNATGQKWTISYSGSGGAFVCNVLGSAAGQDVSYKIGFGSGHGMGVYSNQQSGCNVGIVGSWGPNTQGTLVPGNGSAYHNVYQYMIY